MDRIANSLFDKKIVEEKLKSIVLLDEKKQELTLNVLNLPENTITKGKKSGTEENVKINVVLPILVFLGYDSKYDLVFEEATIRGSIDIAIRVPPERKNINCLIECKYWKKDLDKYRTDDKIRYHSDVQQGVIYATERGIDWFIITNGFEWRLYKSHISGQIVYNFYESFDLDTLKDPAILKKFYFLFCRDSFEKGTLETLFSETELQKEQLNEEIFEILTSCRTKLFENLISNNKTLLNEKSLMEVGQKILDRFVFIRFAEDNNLFGRKILREFLENWRKLHSKEKTRTPLGVYMMDLFEYILKGSEEDKIFPYNGGLFSEDKLLEKMVIDNEVLENIIEFLYKYPNGNYIDFSEIPIDILGHIYEEYLGLSLSIKEKGSELVLKEESTKKVRKKTGIYYTPKYIVNYIIENTIKKKLDESLELLPNIRILDPACGSGTFLGSTYDILYDKYKEYNDIVLAQAKDRYEGLKAFSEAMKKVKAEYDKKILSNNLYGVDLNPESVEITKMSLWFKTALLNVQLNNLEDNIKCGDSLIEDPAISSRAFVWKEGFKTVFEDDNGGFDIVIGNPPYGAKISNSEKKYYENSYTLSTGEKNTAILFIERSLKLLKKNGLCGLVLPKSLTFADSWGLTRKFLLENYQIIELVDLGEAFSGVLLEQIILICKKVKNITNTYIGTIFDANFQTKSYQIPFLLCNELDILPIHIDIVSLSIYNKINLHPLRFKDISQTFRGLPKKDLVDETITENSEPVLHGAIVKPYYLKETRYYIKKSNPLYIKFEKKIAQLHKPKIISQRIVAHVTQPIDHIYIMSTIDKVGLINIDTIENTVITDEKYHLNYVLAFLNSKFCSWFIYYFIFNKAVRTMDFDNYYVSKIPIFPVNQQQQEAIIKLVDNLMELLKNYMKSKSSFLEELNKIPRSQDKSFEFYYSSFAPSEIKMLIKSNQKGKIKNLEVKEEDNNLIFLIDYISPEGIEKNQVTVLQIKIENEKLRKFLFFAINSNMKKSTKQNLLEAILNITIPVLDEKIEKNMKRIENFMEKFIQIFNKQTKFELEIEKTENEINSFIYTLYGLTDNERNFIENSIGIKSVILQLLS